ncbi:MAG TPA: hypothetical protein VMM77_10110 [Gemmatimonadaceae bacterium]|nr:hypothetical protein [Gemmatimonadaceae bacterium]
MKSVLGFLALLLLFPAIADSQAAGLTAGARVRVTAPRDDLNKYVGTIMELRGDSVVVAGRQGSRRIAFGDVTALEVSTGTQTRIVRSGLIGFGAGAVVGAIMGLAAYDGPDLFFDSPASFAAFSGLVFGSVGMVAGGVVGALQRTDRWERRDLPVKVGIGGSRSGGVSLNFSRAF